MGPCHAVPVFEPLLHSYDFFLIMLSSLQVELTLEQHRFELCMSSYV